MKWNGRYYRPGYGIVVYPKKEQSITELLKPLGEKEDKGNVWRPVLNQPINVLKEASTPPPSPSSSPTPTPTGSGTPTPTPTATLTPTPTPSFVPPFDADAAAYLAEVLNQGGTLNATISGATNTLFTDLKSNGLYNKIKVMYPMLGSTANSTKVEGKQPATKNLTWNGTVNVDYSGVTSDGSTGYGDIPLNMSVDMTAYTSSNHISYYSLTPGQSGGGFSWDIGVGNLNTGNPLYGLILRRQSSTPNDFIFDTGNFGTGRLSTTSSDASGFIIGSAESASSRKLWRNGSFVTSGSSTTTGTILNNNFWLFRPNSTTPTTVQYTQHKCAWVSIGDGLTDSEASTLEGIINTFQTTLGRSTYISPTPTPTPTQTSTSTPTPTQTSTSTPTPTPSSTPTSFDADASAYLAEVLNQGGTLNATISGATNTLFTELKSEGIYSKLDLLYLMLGETSGSTKLNAIRVNSSFDITWVNAGSLTFNYSGVTGGGTNGYGNTNYNPRTQSSPTSNSWGIYHTTANWGGNNGEIYTFGAFDGTYINVYKYNPSTAPTEVDLYGYTVGATRDALTGITTVFGSYQATFDSSNIKTLYHNYSDPATDASASLAAGGGVFLPNRNYFLFTLNLNGSPYTGNFFNGRIQNFFAGDYLTSSEILVIDELLNDFETTLGRNLYTSPPLSPTPTPTSTSTPTPTPSSTPPSFDPDAQTFFNAISTSGGTLTSTEENAVNQFVLDLKSYGLWNKMVGLYPVVGSTAVEHQFNLKDPSQYNLTFNGTWTHSSAGVDPVTNAYAQTGIIPSVIDFQTSGSVHFSMYITEDVGATRYDMGAFSAGGGDWGMISEFNGNNTAYIGVGTSFFTTANGGSTKKNWLMTNDGATSYIYRDGSAIGSGAKTISSGAAVELVFNANNNNGSIVDYSTRSWALGSIGLGMDATEASNYNTAVVTFQTALSRQN